jgi:soluble cytochrome b562
LANSITYCSHYYYVQQLQKEFGDYQKEVDKANASGEHLISDVLDDPTVTKQDLEALNEAWKTTCQLLARQKERMKEALEDAKKFEGGLNELVVWIDAQRTKLQGQLPPDEDASVLQKQIEEHKV